MNTLYKLGFVIEQVLGHITHGQNLKRVVAQDQDVEAHWILPSWQTQGLAGKIPVYKSNWTVHAGLQARSSIAKLQRQVALDGLFFHTQVPSILAQKWVRRFPTVISLDATPLQYDRLGDFYDHETGPSWLETKKWQMNVDSFQAARHLVTWSEWAKQGLIDEYEVAPEKISVIPPGVITQDWQRPFPPSFSAAQAPCQILFVGGQFARKGGPVLLEAFRRLRYRLASEGWGETAVSLHLVTQDQLPAEPGVVIYNHMKPNSPELKNLFHTSHIFCLPTYGDCLPMVLSEAGASWLPLVSTSVAAIPEIVREAHSGLLVPPGDAESLENALYQLATQPEMRRQLGENAQKLVVSRYDAAQNAGELLTLLKEVTQKAN
ncbi:MAG: glycosyltransferase family 4 protein [Chloroflexota bacterium]